MGYRIGNFAPFADLCFLEDIFLTGLGRLPLRIEAGL